jgi:hypothetical protein
VRNSEANPDAGHARERISEILRSAMGAPEEDGLEDETRRLMLHLSIEPSPVKATPAPEPVLLPASTRKPLLKRLLKKANGGMSA